MHRILLYERIYIADNEWRIQAVHQLDLLQGFHANFWREVLDVDDLDNVEAILQQQPVLPLRAAQSRYTIHHQVFFGLLLLGLIHNKSYVVILAKLGRLEALNLEDSAK